MKRKGYTAWNVADVILKSILGRLKKSDRAEYDKILSESDLINNKEELSDIYFLVDKALQSSPFNPESAYQRFNKKRNKKKTILLSFIKYAALLVFVISIYFLLQKLNNKIEIPRQDYFTELKKYVDRGDGELINLDDKNIYLFELDGIKITKDSSHILYEITDKVVNPIPIYHELHIPRGGEYSLTLSDGTKIWINSESILRYPIHFGDIREVSIIGEAYFKVQNVEDKPFIVKTSAGEIHVLGTEFNVRDYSDEKEIVTTLVSGCVKYVDENLESKEIILKESHQLITYQGVGEYKYSKVKVNEYVSWREGFYTFNNFTLHDLMKMVERNYDVEVSFIDENCKKLLFSGDLIKYEDLKTFLNIIETGSDVTFKVKNKTIIVYPKKSE